MAALTVADLHDTKFKDTANGTDTEAASLTHLSAELTPQSSYLSITQLSCVKDANGVVIEFDLRDDGNKQGRGFKKNWSTAEIDAQTDFINVVIEAELTNALTEWANNVRPIA